MNVISIVNSKGGVGKTSLAVNLAAGLAHRALFKKEPGRIALLDMDPQASALDYLSGKRDYPAHGSLAEVIAPADYLEEEGKVRPVLAEHMLASRWYENLWFAPNRPALLNKIGDRLRDSAFEDRVEVLSAALESLRRAEPTYRTVIIDTRGTEDMLFVASMLMATHVLVPVTMDQDALNGAALVTDAVSKIRARLGTDKPRILGYVANSVNPAQNEDRRILLALQQRYDGAMFQTLVPRSVRIPEARGAFVSVFALRPRDNPATLAMTALVNDIVARLEAD